MAETIHHQQKLTHFVFFVIQAISATPRSKFGFIRTTPVTGQQKTISMEYITPKY